MKPLLRATLLLSLALSTTAAYASPSKASDTREGDLINQVADLANKTGLLIKDSAITANIYAQLGLDKNLSTLHIKVSTEQGKVSLSGFVNFESQAKALIQLASSATGVQSVDATKLQVVKSDQPLTDTLITTKIKTEFFTNSLFSNKAAPTSIQVETNNGLVKLDGHVSSEKQREEAIRLAKTISGVKSVESTLTVIKENH